MDETWTDRLIALAVIVTALLLYSIAAFIFGWNLTGTC